MQDATVTTEAPIPGYIPTMPSEVGSFDNADLADPSEMMSALDNAPKQNSDHLPRFAISGLLPIPLMRQYGNNSYGDFNPKNPQTGVNIKTFNYYPPFRLMPLFGATFNIPFEPNLGEHNDQPKSAPFDADSFENKPPSGRTTITRTPRECAEIFLRENADIGGAVIHSLTGFGADDPDKGLRRAKKLFELLLPVNDEVIFPIKNIRTRNGVIFKGPFLDELADFVRKQGLLRLRQAGVDITDTSCVEVKCYHELLSILQSNITRANRILDNTEAEMKDANGIKKSYDLPNLEVEDSPVPQDLYCLAHTDRTELDNKALKASEAMSRGLSDPLTAAIERLAAGAAAQPSNVLTEEQIDDIFAKREAEMMERVETRMQEMAAAASSDATGSTGKAKK